MTGTSTCCSPDGWPPSTDDQVEFDALWSRRRPIGLRDDVEVLVPIVDGLILTKQIQPRPKDLEDIRLLNALRMDGQT